MDLTAKPVYRKIKEKGFYRRTIEWNPNGERIFLIFGAVDYTCEVKLNGKVIGSHRGGYDRFEFDVTDCFKRDSENILEVAAVDASMDTADNSAMTQLYGKQGYGDTRGIWQTVWLESRPNAYITGFFVKTKIDGNITYDITAANAEGATVAFTGYDSTAVIKDGKATLDFKVDSPELWTPDTPNLYYGKLVLTLNGAQDEVSTYFGIREIGTAVFGKNNRRYITLNGKPCYINGALDQSFNPKGFFTLPSDEDCRDEILRLKRIGINMARVHLKAEEPLKLYYADKLGMLIMEDIPTCWGNPIPDTMEQFEREMEAEIIRDRNHPSIFYWVIFNETMGLLTTTKDAEGNSVREYKDETADWVVHCYNRVKELDPTRLVEDNSPCNRDHTVTDVNTWHFYRNGYTVVKKGISDFCQNAYVGSTANYRRGYKMEDVPCMNSECGNVWGITGYAGDSDISWQYRYMMNEFRLHDKICGFIFTEFHDVVNEFNGYYKLDNSDKDFGYSEFGASLCDLHSQDYVGADFAPMTTVKPSDKLTIPMFYSSFTDERHGKTLKLLFEFILRDPIDGDKVYKTWYNTIKIDDYGCTMLPDLTLEFPEHDGIAMLKWTLFDSDKRVMSHCLLFDIDSPRKDVLTIEPKKLRGKGFTKVIPAIESFKMSGIGDGEFSVKVKPSDIPNFSMLSNLRLVFEASTRQAMTRDISGGEVTSVKSDLDYLLGYRSDPGKNSNSFAQTDEKTCPGKLEVLLDGEKFAEVVLPDCPADSSGTLSHHYQPADNLLDEAGSYGTLVDLKVPSRLILSLNDKKSFKLTFRASDNAGLSLYGRRSGKYSIGITLIAE